MKTKIKRFSKSTVSILLSLMMLFSCVVTSGAVTVQPERTAVTLDAASENAAVELDSAANADEQTTAQPVALENEKLNADIQDSGANVDVQLNSAQITSSESLVIYVTMAHEKSSHWWNNTPTYHFAKFFGSNGTSNVVVPLLSVKTGSSTATGQNSNDYVFFCTISAGTYESMNLYRGNAENSWENFSTNESSSFYYNIKSGIPLSVGNNTVGAIKNNGTNDNNNDDCVWTSAINHVTCTASLASDPGNLTTVDTFSLKPTLSYGTFYDGSYFEITSHSYSSDPGYTINTENNTVSFSAAGNYTITDTITYHAKGFSTITGTTTATTTINVSAPTTYTNVSVAAQKSDDGSTYVAASEPALTIGGEAGPLNNVVGSTPVTAVESFTSGEDTYRFTTWYSENGTFESATDRSTIFYPSGNADDPIVAIAKYDLYVPVTDFSNTVNQTGGAGTVTVSPTGNQVAGTNISIAVTPPTNKYIKSVTATFGDGQTLNYNSSTTNGVTTYTYEMPAGDVTFNITYSGTYTVYFDTYGFLQADTFKAYAYTGSGNSATKLLGDWPGADMTQVSGSTTKYSIEVPYRTDNTKIIFNNNSKQTADIENVQDHINGTYSLNGNISDSKYQGQWTTPNLKTVYFYNTYGWDTPLRVAGPDNWPGVLMTQDKTTDASGKLYKAQIPTGWSWIIFNSKGVNQTQSTSDITNNAVYTPNKETTRTAVTKNTFDNYSANTVALHEDDEFRIFFQNDGQTANMGWGGTSVLAYTYAPSDSPNLPTSQFHYLGAWPNERNYTNGQKMNWPTACYMTQVPGSDTLYYILLKKSDVSNNDTYHNQKFRIIFTNKDTKNYGIQTIAIDFNGGNSSNRNQVWVPDGNLNNSNEMEGNWANLSSNPFSEGATYNVYAKTGAIRDNVSNNVVTGYFDKYSMMSSVTLTDANNKAISGTVKDSAYVAKDDSNKTYYRVLKANISKNTPFKTTVTIRSAYRSTYYVKAFIINGKTVYPTEDAAAAENGQYYCTYSIGDDEDDPIEITPVYFYKTTSETENNYITFYVDDYEGVRSLWGNTLSCYAWYDNDQTHATIDPTDSSVNANKPALGGYPGQPMIYDGGSYYTQIPITVNNKPVMGILLNNFYLDDIHKTLSDKFTSMGGTGKQNCQTYDYDDFTSLVVKTNNTARSIIFTFKNGTAGAAGSNDSGNKPANYIAEDNEVTSTTINSIGINGANANSVIAGNRWEVLTDYYGYPITLFGQRISDLSASDVYDSAYTNKYYIVSDGYVTAEHDYIGYFATKWFVYNNQGNCIGALPPSAFYDGDVETFADFLGYSGNANTYKYTTVPTLPIDETGMTDAELKTAYNATDDAWEAWLSYKALKAASKATGYPAVITYESNIKAGARVSNSSGVENQRASRCDGRWYYSYIGESKALDQSQIRANVQIEYWNGTEWIRDEPVSESVPYQGTVTTAEAYLTNTNNKRAELELEKDSGSTWDFTADAVKAVKNQDNSTTYYEFVGWYYKQGASSYLPINDSVYNPITNDVNGKRPRISGATFVARYKVIDSSAKITFSHQTYSKKTNTYTPEPQLGNGTGQTYIAVRVLNYTGEELVNIPKTNATATLTIGDLSDSNAAFVEVTLYNTTDDDLIGVYRDTTTAYNTMFGTGTSSVTEWRTSDNSTGLLSDLSDSNALVYLYNKNFFITGSGSSASINENKGIINYYSNYSSNSLKITHNLLETVMDYENETVEQNILNSIVDESGNKITPHHDFFNTSTKIKVEILNSEDTVVGTPVDDVDNIASLSPSQFVINNVDYGKATGAKIRLTLSTTTNGNEYRESGKSGPALANLFGFYNYYNNSYNTYTQPLMNGAIGTNPETNHSSNTYTYTYTVPVSLLFNSTTSKFTVDNLDFFSDPFKRINAEVKYYDRDVSPDSHSKPTDINKTATTVEISYDVSYKNTIACFNSEAISPKFYKIDNILDEHCYWITQSAAIAGIGNTKDFHNSTDKSTSTTDAGVRKYNEDKSADLSYHTDYYGRAKGTSLYKKLKDNEGNFTVDDNTFEEAKWVTYKDSGGFAIPENDNLNDSFGFDTISSVTIWCYNAPKKYSFTAYYVSPTTKQDSTEEDLDATTLVLTEDDKESVTNNGDPTYMYIVNPVKVGCKSINKTGFYNQRLGIPNNDNEIDGHTEYLDAYGITNPYFGITGCDKDGKPIENDKLTGLEVKAVNFAKASEDAENNAYEFDGWYIRDESGYHKISSERFYQNRVVSNIVLYAGYREIPQPQPTQPTNNVGVAVSLNGVDHYVDTDNVRKVRFNTQFNIFGDNVKDHDTDIQNVAAIYMTMPTKDASDNPIDWKNDTYNKALRDVLINQQSAIRTQLEWHKDLLQAQLDSCGNSVVDSKTGKDWYHTYTYPPLKNDLAIDGFTYSDTKPNKIKFDWYAYEVVSKDPSKDLHQVTLTNKNRIQFYKVFDEETYEKTPIIAYVAVKYKDNWYISDNFVSNITYKDNGKEIYFPDGSEQSGSGTSETRITGILNQDMFKRSYEDEIGLEDNGVYIDFTNDYEEEELPLDVLLE